MHISEFIRLSIATAFALIGIFMLWTRPSITRMSGSFGRLRVDDALRNRICASVAWRRQLDRSSPVFSWIFAIAYLALSGALFAKLVTVVLAYAIFIAVGGFLLSVAYLQLLKKITPRAAVLERRPFLGGVPWWMFAVGFVATLSPWVFFRYDAAATAIVFATSWSLLFAALGMTQTPSMVTATDVAVERFVDDRLRMYRVATLLAYSALPTLLFNNLTVALYPLSVWQQALHFALYFVTLAAWTIPLIWEARLLRNPPDSSRYPELASSMS